MRTHSVVGRVRGSLWDVLKRVAVYLLLPAMLLDTPAFAAKKPDPAAVKMKVASRGVGQRVRVTLVDRSEQVGSILAIHDKEFVLRPMAAADRTIAYDQVSAIHKGPRSRKQKVAIGVAVVAVSAVVVGIICAIRITRGVIGE